MKKLNKVLFGDKKTYLVALIVTEDTENEKKLKFS